MEWENPQLILSMRIFWHKKYDPLISVIRLEVDWCIAIKVEHNTNVFVILNVYTPYECSQNEDEYMNRLAFISAFIKESVCTSIFILGDMNADISDNNSLYGQQLIRFVRIASCFFPAKYYCQQTAIHISVRHGIQHLGWITVYVQQMLTIP